jgi:hypothetical protein
MATSELPEDVDRWADDAPNPEPAPRSGVEWNGLSTSESRRPRGCSCRDSKPEERPCAACRVASFKAINSGASERGTWSSGIGSASGVESYAAPRDPYAGWQEGFGFDD